MFRRRRQQVEPDDEWAEETEATEQVDDASAESPETVPTERAVTTGPFDVEDAPEDTTPRLDLGSMRIPVPEGVELRLEVDQETQNVIAAVVVLGASVLQVGVFAAPRSAGIWPEVQDEITNGLREVGGGAEPADGTFGRELQARIPMETETGGRVVQPARFIGVDGPRWFLRGMLQGPAATDPVQARRLEDIFRGVVVVRGGDAMAPRDPLPLHVPRDIADQARDSQPPEPEEPSLNPFERGPEITEIR